MSSSVQSLLDYLFQLASPVPLVASESPPWDHPVGVLQVTEAAERTIQAWALVSAADAWAAWQRRCHVR